ncbi:hypothetical protein LZC95_28340 [Pendulispora brunnea]|uniref:Zinc-finger domain-containing protein n=1 Tax=Pendulispora brunnea TaxID=2905690 RepID=A0ABZ2JV75_9BACT
MTHPNSLDLEAFACGDSVAGVSAHLEACPECRAFVERARQLVASDAPRPPARRTTPRRFVVPLAAAALAAAAALLLVVRAPESETTFKGGTRLAVMRDRDGAQAWFTSSLSVQPGDQLRLEVALDHEQSVLGAIVGDDGSYLELLSAKTRPAGTHLSERSARVDATPLDATIVVGSDEAVDRARRLHRFDDVIHVRIRWEAAP